MAAKGIRFEIIRPDDFKIDEVRQEMLNALRKEGTAQRKRFDGTTATWKGRKPKFKTKVGLTRTSGEASVETVPGGDAKGVQKWGWLNEGTKAHWVPKGGVATMAFSPGYKAKTRRGKLSSGAGGPRGNRIVRRGRWRVSGIEARDWDETLAKERRKPFKKATNDAIARGTKKAGMR